MNTNKQQKIHEVLAKEHACYVLITCDTPSEDGSMNVQMSYEGDSTLASYLVHGAQNVLSQEEDNEDNTPLRLIE